MSINRLVLAATAVLAIDNSAQAASFAPSIARRTAIHTVAPSHFSAPVSLAHFNTPVQSQPSIFTAPATGPAGAQFGRLPATNNSFIDPTRNSVNAHQTQNSVQATNTMESSQAVQGRNCTLNAIRAGLCQGR